MSQEFFAAFEKHEVDHRQQLLKIGQTELARFSDQRLS